jgi:hypothetical protein
VRVAGSEKIRLTESRRYRSTFINKLADGRPPRLAHHTGVLGVSRIIDKRKALNSSVRVDREIGPYEARTNIADKYKRPAGGSNGSSNID